MHVAQQDVMKWHARGDSLAELSRQALTIARDLHIGLMRNAVAIAHDDGWPGHTFASDDANLDSLLSVGDDRGHPALDKVHLLDALVLGCKHFAKGEINGLKMRLSKRKSALDRRDRI